MIQVPLSVLWRTAVYMQLRKQSVVIYIGYTTQIAVVGAPKLQGQRSALAKMTLQA